MSMTAEQAARLNITGFTPISAIVNARALFSLLIAAAMLLAPLAIQSGAAMAMSPAASHAEMMKSGHCDDGSNDSQDKGKAAKSCCVAMCAAAAVSPAASIQPRIVRRAQLTAAPQDFRFGYFGELPTPPPRSA